LTSTGLRKRHSGAKEAATLANVSDTGTGIDEKTLPEFSTFLTTKEPGKGTGLGWRPRTASSSKVEVHLGSSEVGQGTTFRIYVPAPTSRGNRDLTDELSSPKASKGERSWLVEDAAALRR